MNKLTLILVITFLALACRTKQPLIHSSTSGTVIEDHASPTNFSDQMTWVLGYFTPERIKRAPHSEWYFKGYDTYTPDQVTVNKLTDIGTENITIKIVLGTWCPDSRREVPRFIKIIDMWKFPPDRVTYIGVDDSKLSPVAEYPGLDIQRVPTFIIYKNNVEAGRIIENPLTSLEQDILNILTKE
ncbi:MAG: thioredoxin [Bacteroidales bacterium]|jgi:thiol-disulfide isomerase/thioredoxin|nr:thioredoxin [Bacteroidales bacterium]NMD02343.1 thioredoxin family protein [Bacteroidales bacterium]OQB62537.1 MAG: hypothetical protein BWX96_01414 [Bacteroidetes bacterium ADurb.Bin145]HOU01247.1 thioredoxin family protein [Bacteroidales bacterium]HQK67150.1 thioredoxin family protein [Bacteroidales bacterium]